MDSFLQDLLSIKDVDQLIAIKEKKKPSHRANDLATAHRTI
jgi:hypothetical protein